MLMKLMLVGLGGGVGAMGRYGLQETMRGWAERAAFPVGTLAVNLAGCVLIGVLGAWMSGPQALREEHRLLLAVGVLGGFTTFSAFSWETIDLMRQGMIGRAAVYVLATNILCLGGTWAGWSAARRVMSAE